MILNLAAEVLQALQGKTLATAESCTGGGIGQALTGVSGASKVYKGGIVSYCNEIKHALLGVDAEMLQRHGAVSAPVAKAMAEGARKQLQTDVAVSVTGLAGPDGDEYGNPVGRVYIGYCDENGTENHEYIFHGDRESVREQAIRAALAVIREKNK